MRGGGGVGGVGGEKKKKINWSFSELFFLISPEKNSKTSKANQQSLLNF